MRQEKENPTLSIITATYNRIDSLKRTVASVRGQRFRDIEHIIIDNESNDGTEEFISEYKAGSDYSVVYIRERDSGIYQALNKGIRAACGDWVHILHSDDYYFDASVLEARFAEPLAGYDVCANSILYVKESTQFQQLWTPEYQPERNHYSFPHTGLLVRRRFYQEYGLFSERYRIISDAIWMARNLPLSKYVIQKEPLIVMSKGGISTRKSVRNFYETAILVLCYQKYPAHYKRAFLKIHGKKFIKYCLKRLLSLGSA